MSKWRDVTDTFSEERRYYKETYLEIDEVYDEQVEVSLFSSETGPYEIYVSYGRMYGIIYSDAEHAEAKREEVKKILAEEYDKHKEPTDEFINKFCKEQEVCMPGDVLFDDSFLYELMDLF